MENNTAKQLQESLKRHRELLGYDPTKGTTSLNEVRRHTYTMDEENTDYADEEETETEETETEEGGDNPDFDFGGEEGAEEGEDTEEGGFDFGGGEEGGEEDTEGETDEFGTADEFSAADDIESDEESDTEEIDVTDIVKRADDAKGYAEKAVTAAEEGKNMIQDLMSKFEALQTSLSKIDTVSNEIQSMKKDIQSQKPKEKLELRSLDSYPFNVKLTDYWNDEKIKSNYEINGGTPDAESQDGEVKVWKLDPKEAKDFSSVDIKKSFVPESKNKKKVLTEAVLWDKIRDKWFELTSIAKSMGYTLSKVPTLYSLKKKGDEEGYDKLIGDIHNYAERLFKKHPNHELKSKLQEVMYDIEKLDDLTYKEFDKDPSKFSPQQQDILMKGMKVTDKGVERDRDIYNLKK